MTLYCGIDPGLDGALVVIGPDTIIWKSMLMPTLRAGTGAKRVLDTRAVLQFLESITPTTEWDVVIALEEPSVRPKEGASRSLACGRNHGRIEGLIVARGIRYDVVRPQRWRRSLGLPLEGDPKDHSIAFCDRMLPGLVLTPGKRTKQHSGLADAGCLALFARKELGAPIGGLA